MLTEKQKRRLGAEKKILEQKLPQFKFFNILGCIYVAGETKTSDGCKYKLKLEIGQQFPEEIPKLYVVYPSSLRTYNDRLLNCKGTSHFFHTRESGPGACVQICHDSLALWNPSKSIFGVMLKGLIWLEGYCSHLRTGKSIAEFCDEITKPIIQVPKHIKIPDYSSLLIEFPALAPFIEHLNY